MKVEIEFAQHKVNLSAEYVGIYNQNLNTPLNYVEHFNFFTV